MKKFKSGAVLKILTELSDIVRYLLLSAMALIVLTGILILNILFVIPPLFDVELMSLLNVTHPDDIASAVIELSVRIALFIIIAFWITYLPRVFTREVSSDARSANDATNA